MFTKKLVPVADLKAEEVRLLENDKERKVLGVEPDRRPLEVAVVVDSGATVAASYAVQAFDVQGYLGQVAKAYHGAYVEAFSTLAVAQWLRQLAADLNGQHRVRYESEAGREGELKVEIRRKDTKSRVGRSVAEIATLQ